MNIHTIAWTASLWLSVAVPEFALAQQPRPIGLAEAVAEARANQPRVGIAEARAVAARQQVTTKGADRWPSLVVEAGFTSSSDPVAAFGGRLRQGRFTEADFDPARLNDPAALSDLDGAVVLGWTPFDLSRDAGVEAARASAEAARMSADWAKSLAGFEAEVRYVEAAGAELVLRSLDVALEAAEANLALVSARASEGMVTEADVLRARAEVERTRARRIVADQAVADARARLALALGWSPRVVPVPDTDVVRLGTDSPVQSPAGRADLTASDAGVMASTAAATAAGRARLPTVRGFAQLETHSDASFESRGDSWSVGVRVSMPLFTGFALGARRRASLAELEAVSLEHERRLDEARAALAEARRGAESLRQAALAAEAGSAAGREAARLMRLRYEEGLTTTAELLATESAAVEQETAAIRARLDHRIAVARLLLLDDPRLDTDTGGGVDR